MCWTLCKVQGYRAGKPGDHGEDHFVRRTTIETDDCGNTGSSTDTDNRNDSICQGPDPGPISSYTWSHLILTLSEEGRCYYNVHLPMGELRCGDQGTAGL